MFMTRIRRVKFNQFRTGGGARFMEEMEEWLSSKEVAETMDPSQPPQESTEAERKNRALIETTRAMLKHAGAPATLWDEAMLRANEALNSISRRIPGFEKAKSPHTAYKNKLAFGAMQVTFGCLGLYWTPKKGVLRTRGGSAPVAFQGIYAGPEIGTRNHRVIPFTWNLNSRKFEFEATLVVAKCKVFEHIFPLRASVSDGNHFFEIYTGAPVRDLENSEKELHDANTSPRSEGLSTSEESSGNETAESTRGSDSDRLAHRRSWSVDVAPSASPPQELEGSAVARANPKVPTRVGQPKDTSRSKGKGNRSEERPPTRGEFEPEPPKECSYAVELPSAGEHSSSGMGGNTYEPEPRDFSRGRKTPSRLANESLGGNTAVRKSHARAAVIAGKPVQCRKGSKCRSHTSHNVPDEQMLENNICTKWNSGIHPAKSEEGHVGKRSTPPTQKLGKGRTTMTGVKPRPVSTLRKAMHGPASPGHGLMCEFRQHLKSLGWKPFEGEPALLQRKFGRHAAVLATYADDEMLSGPQQHQAQIWRELRACFATRHPQRLSKLLSIVTRRRKDGNSTQCNPKFRVHVKTGTGSHVESKRGRAVRSMQHPDDDWSNQSSIGALLYLTHDTRPDVAYAIGKFSRGQNHWSPWFIRQLEHPLDYIKLMESQELVFKSFRGARKNLRLRPITDCNREMPQSSHGWIITVEGQNVTNAPKFLLEWRSKKQALVATQGGTGARAMHGNAKAAIRIGNILTRAGLQRVLDGELETYSDRSVLVRPAKRGYSPAVPRPPRTLGAGFKCLQDWVKFAQYINTMYKKNRLLTKPLGRQVFEYHVREWFEAAVNLPLPRTPRVRFMLESIDETQDVGNNREVATPSKGKSPSPMQPEPERFPGVLEAEW